MNRFHPFRRSSSKKKVPPESDGFAIVQHAFADLLLRNEQQFMSSWHHDTDTWYTPPRPQRTNGRGDLLPLAASGFRGRTVPDVFCPHTRPNGRPYLPCTLHLGGEYRGGRADFYQAREDHLCRFKMVVPPLPNSRKAKVLTSWDDIHEYQKKRQRDLEEEDEDGRTLSSPSSTPSSSQYSASTSQSTSQSRIEVETMLDPCRPSEAFPSQQPTPTPRHRRSGASEDLNAPCSIFSFEVAEARAKSNIIYIDSIMEKHVVGYYRGKISSSLSFPASDWLPDHPFSHPLAQEPEQLPYAMQAYDRQRHPSCTVRTFNNLEFFTTRLGQLLRHFLSTIGITFNDYRNMIWYAKGCGGCGCMFSYDGYNSHLKAGQCRNHPNLKHVGATSPPVGTLLDFSYRTYYKNQQPPNTDEVLDSPTGLALLEWNSRIGIPYDVWSTVSTAYIHCSDCDLLRSFTAHRLHLNDSGDCADPGQAMLLRLGTESDGDD
ncbi:hypothetical protein C8J57DRAFT_1520013 [Mycena rebaudengoi]|nr:hypothetical protein C8J57DRAFT_1520013 [Mycena rebaudengoi]